jgi:hypothetical protein
MGSDSYAGKIVMTDESGGASAGAPMEIALADDIAALDVSISRNGHGAMSQELEPHADSSQPMAYQIRITGQLDARWADWFEGLTITLDGGDTLITGPVVDQAVLHGLLKRVRDLGMPLVSVSPVESGPSTTLGTGLAGVSDVKSNVGGGGLSTSTSTTTGT